ncbi:MULTISPECIES: GrpB family protein [Amycolatopsis]|uniref:GrpB family protein n=1 Tax=Amycolatopsis albidoflavus TaxID=102226 RepID=A0ABW5I8M8_9PSEU
MSVTPDWAYERPEVHPPDPTWASRGSALCAELTRLLSPWLAAGQVEHVGSTAVPGLAAKPVLDVMASMRDLSTETVSAVVPVLSAGGWCFVPPELDVAAPWRRFFVLPDAAGRRRVAHLHLLPEGHPRWQAQLKFRDALRADPGLAEEYAEVKRRLAGEVTDREEYTAGKTDFVRRALGG